MEQLNKVINIFNELQNTSSRNEKEAIIAANKDNGLFLTCLRFLLDTNNVTGISAKKWNKLWVGNTTWKHDGEISSDFVKLLEYITKHNTGRDEDVIMCQAWCCDLSEEIKAFTEGMITKSIKLGIDAKTVNKVIPNLIRTFNVCLGTPIDKCKLKGDEWISISRKLNGTRTAFIGDKCMTRQGKEYKGLDHIVKDLIDMGYENYFVDGELLYKNEEGLSDSEAFQKGTGIAMSKDSDKTQLKLVVFDVFPLDEFWSGQSKLSYKERKDTYITSLRNDIELFGVNNIEIVPMVYEGYDHSEIWKWLDYAEANDWEGVMINLDTPYECKRTKNLIKVKKFFTIDLRCTSVNIATTGKYKGLMGSITCKYGNGTVDVGSGFTDHERMIYTANPEYIIDKIIEIKYKEMTTNKDGGKSLQFPIFQVIRDPSDKNVADDEV